MTVRRCPARLRPPAQAAVRVTPRRAGAGAATVTGGPESVNHDSMIMIPVAQPEAQPQSEAARRRRDRARRRTVTVTGPSR